MDRIIFFKEIKKSLFGGKMAQGQADGINMILDVWGTWVEQGKVDNDLRKLAYICSTSYHETGQKMQAVREIGRGKGRPYGNPSPNGQIHYGRGDVQLTWPDNYKKMGKLLGLDLYNNPDLALINEHSKAIMFEGMLKANSSFGDFTGKCLEMYFNDKVEDPIEARRIINKLDRANLIKSYYDKWLAALRVAA